MIATVVNAAAVVIGTLIGLIFHARIQGGFKTAVYNSIGIVSLILGFSMALETQRVLYMALSLVFGGIIGYAMHIEEGILNMGEFLRKRFAKSEEGGEFAYGFLSASVLFCVGALAIIGSFKAGVEGNYELLFTKSVMDGFMAVMLTGAMGVGVGFSALSILIYQGALTLLSVWIRPLVTDLVLSELTGVGGALVIMIGINLLALKEIKTANYIPSLVIVLIFVALDPILGSLVQM